MAQSDLEPPGLGAAALVFSGALFCIGVAIGAWLF